MENGEQIINNGLVSDNDVSRVPTTEQSDDEEVELLEEIKVLEIKRRALYECNSILKRENKLFRDIRNREKHELDSQIEILNKNIWKKNFLIKLAKIILEDPTETNPVIERCEQTTNNCAANSLNNCTVNQQTSSVQSQNISSTTNGDESKCDQILVTTNGHIDDSDSLPSSDLIVTPIILKPAKVALNKQIPVYISYVENPSNIWVQLKYNKVQNFIHNIRVTQTNALKIGNHSLSCRDIYVGMYCVALYSEDSDWYRAQVIAIDCDNASHRSESFDKVRVRYIDWGNEADVHITNITKMAHNLIKRKQSVKCYLQGLTPENKIWPPEVVSQFKRIVCGETQLFAVFSKPENEFNSFGECFDNIYPIDLFKDCGNNKVENVLHLLSEHICSPIIK